MEPTKTLDVRGKICPYPDMDTMTTLKKMEKG
jgi:TusA-related sulfurtransferase